MNVKLKSQKDNQGGIGERNSIMGEDPLPRLKKCCISLGWFESIKKRNILIAIILVIIAGLFFSIFFKRNALAENAVFVTTPDPDVLDPLSRIGQSFQESLTNQKENQQLCEVTESKDDAQVAAQAVTLSYQTLVQGHPMEAMAPQLAQKDRAVAAFLISIAKKESDWGTHSPKKAGRECFNFWGYKGGYNVTDGGYSCFDSPEQAVDIVGARIQTLIAQKIDTPARMVVWKCGSAACIGFDPVDVQKWISDVSAYYYQMMS